MERQLAATHHLTLVEVHLRLQMDIQYLEQHTATLLLVLMVEVLLCVTVDCQQQGHYYI